MRKKIKPSLGPGIDVEEIELRDGRWVLSARAAGERSCPVCSHGSTSRHDWHHRRLQDLPVHPCPTTVRANIGPRHRRRQERHRRTMEQWPGRSPNQQIENPQADHVRPRRHRIVAGTNAATPINRSPRKVTKTPFRCVPTPSISVGYRLTIHPGYGGPKHK